MFKTAILSFIFLLSLVVGTSYASVCQVWNGTFGVDGGEVAQWNFTTGTPEHMFGSGISRQRDGTRVTYELQSMILSNHVTVFRTQSSIPNDCTYSGTKVGNYVHGTFLCARYTPQPLPWSAHISDCQSKLKN